MKYKLIYIVSLVLCFNAYVKLQAYTPTTAPYYGTAEYPYWGKYVKTPFSAVTAAPWVNTDGVVVGWDWSLPKFV